MKHIGTALLTLLLLTNLLLPAGSITDPVAERMRNMSLREKITQMLMVDFRYWEDDGTRKGLVVLNDQVRKIVEDYHFGAVLYFAQNLADTEQAFDLTMAFQQAAVDGGGIPMLICADQEGGSVYRLATGTALPGNMALGATGSLEYAMLSGKIIGSELSVLGINTNLAPVVDVNNNAANPVIGLRSYSDDPETVGQLASAAIAGMAKYDVIGCAKHFPGHGDTEMDSHYGLPIVDKSLEDLRSCELLPYRIAIDQGVEMIMTAHILYPQLEQKTALSKKTGKVQALPATMSQTIVTDLLKKEMGFNGIVVTDAMNMAGIADHWDPVQAVVLAIDAGVDMVCMPCSLSGIEDIKKLDAIVNGVMAAVEDTTIPMDRIDDAVRRILTVKKNRGILNWNAERHSLEKALETVGSGANREAERRMAAAAVTVVENKNRILPLQLKNTSKVLMLVPYDNEKAQMILGWNRAAEAGLIPEGAQVQVVRFQGDSTLETFRSEIDWADILIINSEISQANRLNGGRWESAYILQVLDYASQAGKTTIVQSVDKPYDVQSYDKADAVLAVYGCKGSGLDATEALVGGLVGDTQAFGPNIVAGIEVIFGMFSAEGKLPVDIPCYENGAFTKQIRYPRGYGLHYNSLLPEPELPEVTETSLTQTEPATQPPAAEEPMPEKNVKSEKYTLLAPLAAACGLLLLLAAAKNRKRK